jgi:hypothetical protein
MRVALSISMLGAFAACGHQSSQDAGQTVDCVGIPVSPGASQLVPAYAPNMVSSSSDGEVKITLVEANPAPPIVPFNSWTIKVADVSGVPLANLGITSPLPYMPYHGHSSSQLPLVSAQGSDGTYSVTNLDFFMPGVWQTTFNVPHGTGETVYFYFCVQG